ncbi:hypothetical protein VSQ48_13960 [Candidatus Ventrimonas sp. KK005]
MPSDADQLYCEEYKDVSPWDMNEEITVNRMKQCYSYMGIEN